VPNAPLGLHAVGIGDLHALLRLNHDAAQFNDHDFLPCVRVESFSGATEVATALSFESGRRVKCIRARTTHCTQITVAEWPTATAPKIISPSPTSGYQVTKRRCWETSGRVRKRRVSTAEHPPTWVYLSGSRSQRARNVGAEASPLPRQLSAMDCTIPQSEQQLRHLPQTVQLMSGYDRFNLHDPSYWQKPYAHMFQEYLPQNCRVFAVPCFWVRRRFLHVFESHPGCVGSVWRTRSQSSEEEILFPVHPLGLDHYRGILSASGAVEVSSGESRILGTASSSPRTLLAWHADAPHQPFYIKTTIPLSSAVADWHLKLHKVAFCVGISSLIRRDPSLPQELEFMPESVGLVPRMLPQSGSIIRSLPQEITRGTTIAAPLFSLIGGNEAHPPLLLTLHNQGHLDVMEFVEQTLCHEFARIWCELYLGCGMTLEAHAQNTFCTFTPTMKPTHQFIYKDFDGIMVDWRLRQSLGAADAGKLPLSHAWDTTYAAMFPELPYNRMAWVKMTVSLRAYVHLFLAALNRTLQQWQSQRLVRLRNLGDNRLTRLFSERLFEEAAKWFGCAKPVTCDIHENPNRFLKFILAHRDVGNPMAGSERWRGSP
jgi:hypothetical protein